MKHDTDLAIDLSDTRPGFLARTARARLAANRLAPHAPACLVCGSRNAFEEPLAGRWVCVNGHVGPSRAEARAELIARGIMAGGAS